MANEIDPAERQAMLDTASGLDAPTGEKRYVVTREPSYRTATREAAVRQAAVRQATTRVRMQG